MVEVCILAGGLSTRMGMDKAKVRLGRRTLLGHVRTVAAETGWKVRVIREDVVARCGPLGGVLTGMLTSKGALVGDFRTGGGHPSPRPSPLRGAREAETLMASHSPSKSIYVFLSCDMPFVQAVWLKKLVRVRKTSGAKAVFTEHGSFVGFPFALTGDCKQMVEAQRVKGEFSLQALAKVLRAERLAVTEREAWRFMNVNTPEALEEARLYVGLSHSLYE